jgi:hypothetical protein
MKKSFTILWIAFFALHTTAFSFEDEAVLGNMISEKTYPDNTRTCYFEINKIFSPQTKKRLKAEAEENLSIMQLSFFDDNQTMAMFSSVVEFTLDSVVAVINNILAENPALQSKSFAAASAPQRVPPKVEDCLDNAAPFCTTLQYNYPDYGGITGTEEAGCLHTTPNRSWYWFEIDQTGNLEIEIHSRKMSDPNVGADVDFICWGPFITLEEACNSAIPFKGKGKYDNEVSCSYSRDPDEICKIPNATRGEIYLILITNFEKVPANISFSQTSGSTATTNCGIVAPTITYRTPLCVGGALQLSVNGENYDSYRWTGPNNFTSTNRNPTIPNVTKANEGEYILVVEKGGIKTEVYKTVNIYEPQFFEYTDTICKGGKYYFNENFLTVSGTYLDTLQSSFGCDSTVTLHLFVDSCYVVVNSVTDICSGSTTDFIINYEAFGGHLSCVSATFGHSGFTADYNCENTIDGTVEVSVDQNQNIRPDYYSAVLTFDYIGNTQTVKKIEFAVLYPDTIIEQKWNDVLALLNSNNNGGYTFSHYEWRKNGKKIDGADRSYYYAGENNLLDFNAEYQAYVTRADDNVTLLTCAVKPEQRNLDENIIPSFVDANGNFFVRAKDNGTITFISITGITIGSQPLTAGDNYIQAPLTSGFYIIVVEEKNQPPTKQIMLVK